MNMHLDGHLWCGTPRDIQLVCEAQDSGGVCGFPALVRSQSLPQASPALRLASPVVLDPHPRIRLQRCSTELLGNSCYNVYKASAA